MGVSDTHTPSSSVRVQHYLHTSHTFHVYALRLGVLTDSNPGITTCTIIILISVDMIVLRGNCGAAAGMWHSVKF
jgi:hypothetical protein